ncbi:cytochrome P450 [Streptacidiphilus sp. ASG 303]|uniref:cytochrome P450 n=1 Tax=Streptacidiphilus sp. ASG 303 TaxID=2896847 RepID=UPI001E4D6181|nr:cytochrome P450 [Streptacidiphilus sp. ASG 303]MCD0484212.1 cytochrome P450 [Streptacidiphilus sp. ASG 303]
MRTTEPAATGPTGARPTAPDTTASGPTASDTTASGPTAPGPAPAALPVRRTCPFDPPPEYRRLREEDPVSRLAFPDGGTGRLLTRHEDVRALLADDRFSADRLHASSPVRTVRPPADPASRAGVFIGMDPPEHTRYRRILTRYFTVRRMRALAPAVERIVEDHLDAMERTGPPVDLVRAFALPVPSLVICELLGVPYEDRARFQAWSAALLRVGGEEAGTYAAMEALRRYMLDLVAAKRDRPDDALLSALLHRDEPEAALSDEEVAGVGRLLLIAGHETTANMLALGTYALLRHPDQLRLLREHPDRVGRAVEELLRHLSIVQFGTVRVAREDVEFAGHRIRAGETVVASLAAANRDPAHFPDPDRLDLTREPSQHVAFGHGVHQCLGQQLARVEMETAFPALFRRFPTLRLAVPPEQLRMRDDMVVYGVHELPVAWEV